MNKNKVAIIVYFLFLAVSSGLALFSFEGYSIVSNTTSHLGAQGSPNALVMNFVFMCLGAMSIWITLSSKIRFNQVIGMIFGLSLILTGVFRHAPLIDYIEINKFHDQMHSIFASATGFSFTFLAAGHGFMTHKWQRASGLIMAIVATLIPLGMMALPSYMGLLQRVMFVSAFGWLFFYMKPPNELKK
ncbi:MAG: DUF998 domain-containing protein [Bacillota bacterium]|nr:DUF998 domain-containing protein [Bacillota bacterium]